MTIERPMFPPGAEPTDSFSSPRAPNPRQTETLATESPKPAQGLYRRTDLSPEDFFQALGRVRRQVRDEIERLVEWLDSTIDCDEDCAIDDEACDGDLDLEPSLGSFDRMSNQVKAWQNRTFADVDCELDRCDCEPALGAPENPPDLPYTTVGHFGRMVSYGPAGRYRDLSGSQQAWALGNSDDREGDPGCDDLEPNVDADRTSGRPQAVTRP